MGKTRKALRRAGYTAEEVQEYTEAATAGDYNDLLAVTMDWVEVK